jgi:hypothetical protein
MHKEDMEKHHILPKRNQKRTLGRIWDNTTIPLRHGEHVQTHREIKEHGPIGALSLLEARRLKKLSKKLSDR